MLNCTIFSRNFCASIISLDQKDIVWSAEYYGLNLISLDWGTRCFPLGDLSNSALFFPIVLKCAEIGGKYWMF